MPIPYAIDPTLHSGPPAPQVFNDGFHPPPRQDAATHPVEPEPPESGPADPVPPNPSHLPVEPEFAPDWRPAEPEDPGTRPPLP
ncbi:MAG: hypothetical protein RIS88_2020 [Pseudomonadota bacterium]|jgi:hypothetical protein